MMNKNSTESKCIIARRKKQFLALFLATVFVFVPTADVLAAIDISTSGSNIGGNLVINGTTLFRNENATWTYDASGSGNIRLVVVYKKPDGTDSTKNGNRQYYFSQPVTSTVGFEDCGIIDLDHWEMSDDPDFYYDGSDYSDTCKITLQPVMKANVTVNVSPAGTGTAKATNGGADITVAGTGDTINLSAEAASGYEFTNWTSNNTNISKTDFDKDTASFGVTNVNEDIVITANFKKKAEPAPAWIQRPKQVVNEDESEHHSSPVIYNPDAISAFYYKNNVFQTNALIGKQEQSALATELFRRAVPVGWKWAFPMSMSVNGKNEHSLKDGVIKLYVPSAYQKNGRQFAFLAMDKNGNVVFLPDKDILTNIVTVNPNLEGYAYVLIYKD